MCEKAKKKKNQTLNIFFELSIQGQVGPLV